MPSKPAYSVNDILRAFDTSAAKWRFVVLDGGKEEPADGRMTAYRDDQRWALVLEELMFCPQSPGHWGVVDSLYTIGNCVPPGRDESIRVTSDGPEAPAFLPPLGLDVNPQVRSIRIRDKVVPVDLSPEHLRRKGIPLPRGGEVNHIRDGVTYTESHAAALGGHHLLWSLLPENRDLLLATDDEKRRRVPAELPKFMQLEEWNHPLILSQHVKPSESETFQMLAEAIVTGLPQVYKPTLPPNTHWKNWLDCARV